MKFALIFAFLLASLFFLPQSTSAQVDIPSPTIATESAQAASEAASSTAEEKDVTQPEEQDTKQQVLALLKKRNADTLSFTNFTAYAVQYAVNAGVPANTIILIMLLPFLATIVVASRYLIGLTSMGLLVPIALSITLLATGIIPGLVMLLAILVASFFSRFLLKKIRIMQMPKMALSMIFVGVFLFAALTISASLQLFDVRDLSIFPILLLLILSDRVVALFLERNLQETIEVTSVTLILGMIGFILLSWEWLRFLVLVYPELVLLLIPINIAIGRYFGLRVTEYFRFQPIMKSK